MPINSHIQLPNGILKQFRESSGRVFYLDIGEKHIGMTSTKAIGVETGYYSDKTEQYLNHEIETPFFALTAKVRAFVDGNSEVLTLPIEAENTFKKYITGSMVRSDLALNTFLDSSVTADQHSPQRNRDDLIGIATRCNAGIVPIIENYAMAILVNRTQKNLVVPRNCFYTVPFNGAECIVAPISPICALLLLPENCATNFISDGMVYIDIPHDIEVMNIRALSYEYVFNKGIVVSISKKELEELMSFLEQNENILEMRRKQAHQ